MKKNLLLLFISLFTLNFYSQSEVKIYNSEGKYITSTAYINKVSPDFFNNEDVYQHSVFKDGIFTIAFIKFTNKVLFISTDGNPTDKQIKAAINSFSLNDYFKSVSFTSDLKKKIENKNFTDLQVLRTFGKPERSTENNEIKIFYYTFPNITLLFNKGILYDYVLSK
ncbi:hypothetical protein P3875_04290 [Myroides sp. JBRI-B21084]|uniref:hypothetical protein n=1 Tax=Myroides sp. JBRI-B21084 TaxID=3119977 RepID=UPI0026E44F89|nr:hypothetical protein [Paenimyroides cloacae]WKW47292.1 hypothetical protein P3875_04290 [Paenimyroides cloacae]